MSNATQENGQHQTDTRDVRPNERHATWCNQEEHQQLEEEGMFGPVTGCVGSPLQVGRVGGWITGIEADRVVVDWKPAEGWDSMTPQEAADMLGFLIAVLAQHGERQNG